MLVYAFVGVCVLVLMLAVAYLYTKYQLYEANRMLNYFKEQLEVSKANEKLLEERIARQVNIMAKMIKHRKIKNK